MFQRQKRWALAIVTLCVMYYAPSSVLASEQEVDYDAMIKQQQEVLSKLEEQKNRRAQEEYVQQIKALKEQVAQMKTKLESYDSSAAIEALAARFNEFGNRLDEQQKEQSMVMSRLNNAAKEAEEKPAQNMQTVLINPGPSPSMVIQDGKNGQAEAQMNFAYAQGQIYKIYCKVGYLTDLKLQKGEQVTFIGGGDTARWMIDTAQAADTPHIYIKPIAKDATTNLIINTNRHTYQILAVSSDWYNPMVAWSYSSEEQLAAKLQKSKDETFYTEREMAVANAAQLNFKYKVKGKKSLCPLMAFDDGKKTYLKFDKERMRGTLPVLFIKERGKKEVSMVNYRVKGDCYIVDRVLHEAELRFSERDIVKIKAA